MNDDNAVTASDIVMDLRPFLLCSTNPFRCSIDTVMNGTIASTASDAIIDPTENTIVPMTSSTAATASAAVTRRMETFFGGECVRNDLHLHLARMRRDDGTAQGRMPPRAAAAVLLPPYRVAPHSACIYLHFTMHLDITINSVYLCMSFNYVATCT